jgi:uncharacterized protein YjbI with pentapeptide repeats
MEGLLMANEEHLKILEEGAEAWNKWRGKNLTVIPNFSEANLSGADLNKADLNKADLSETNLRGANLSYADLSGTDLRGADLSRADLRGANLSDANLNDANLSDAILIRVNLSNGNLTEANLSDANLTGADLGSADLSQAILTRVNLQKASLYMARLIGANLDGANLTEARIWEIQRAGWSIKGVICESIYWDEKAKEKTNYALGEFERLFADNTRIKLYYEGGIHLLEIATLPALIQRLEDSHPGARLRFISIKEDSGGAVVELAIECEEDYSPEQIKQLQIEANEGREYQRRFLAEGKQRLQLEARLDELRLWQDKQLLLLASSNQNFYQGVTEVSNKTFNVSGQAAIVGDHGHAHNNTFNQLVNQSGEPIDLAALASQLAELRQAIMQKQDASPQASIAIGEVAKAEIAATEDDAPKAISHLKAAGQWTLDFAKSVGKDVVVTAIKKSMGMG